MPWNQAKAEAAAEAEAEAEAGAEAEAEAIRSISPDISYRDTEVFPRM